MEPDIKTAVREVLAKCGVNVPERVRKYEIEIDDDVPEDRQNDLTE